MKKTRRVAALVIIAAAVLSLSSCGWVIAIFNHMNIEGEFYSLDELVVEYLGSDGMGNHLFDVLLLSEDLDYSEISGITGNGDGLGFILVGDDNELSEGDYRYDSASYAAGTFFDAGAVTGFVRSSTGELIDVDQSIWIDAGNVWIRETLLGEYVIEFELDGVDEETGARVDVDGRFRGEIDRFIDNSSMAMTNQTPTFSFR